MAVLQRACSVLSCFVARQLVKLGLTALINLTVRERGLGFIRDETQRGFADEGEIVQVERGSRK